jgi:putative peptidoglycan lipid II flippase
VTDAGAVETSTAAAQPARGGAALVAAGIFLSRIFGLVRNRLIGHFLGAGMPAEAFFAAIRIPNFLQNMFGEGVLSASFIPVYARLLAEGNEDEAGRVAGAVGSLLALTSAVIVLAGIVAAPLAIPLIAPGFTGEKRDLTILLVQIMFPGVGLLVLSAWTMGILNSHRKFFLSYASGVAMNVVMIAALLRFGPLFGTDAAAQASLVPVLAWASVVGSALQLFVQLPTVIRVDRKLRAEFAIQNPQVRTVLTNFVPVFVGRGVVQISAYADGWLASYAIAGSVAVLGYAQVISILPVSLFGMAVSAAALPAMSGELGSDEAVAAALRARLHDGLHRIAFYVVPSSMAFLALGDVVAGVIYQSGQFTRGLTVWTWMVLAGSAVGLLASTLGRLYSSVWYALRNTRTPLNYALIRVALTISLGYVAALKLPGWLGISPTWSVAGLTASAGIAAWVEFALLRRSIAKRIGPVGVDARYVGTLWLAAGVSAIAGYSIKLLMGVAHPLVLGLVALPVYGVCYFSLCNWLELPEASAVLGRVGRLVGRW